MATQHNTVRGDRIAGLPFFKRKQVHPEVAKGLDSMIECGQFEIERQRERGKNIHGLAVKRIDS